MNPRLSVVIPAYNEGEAVVPFLDRICEAITLPAEVLVIYNSPDDTTVPFLRAYAKREQRLKPLHNTYGRGPAQALRYGIDHAVADVVVVTMADGSDDPMQIDQLTRLVERGVVVACASRYMRGGQQVGGPWLKGRISRLAGVSLNMAGRVGTHDATNSFKAYSRQFIQRVGIELGCGVRAGDRAGCKSSSSGPARCRNSHHLARPRERNVEFSGQGLDSPISALVPVCARPRKREVVGGLGTSSRWYAMKKVMVTGSAGFIGGYIVEELLQRGYHVVGLDNESKYGPATRSYDGHAHYRLVRGDARDVELLAVSC